MFEAARAAGGKRLIFACVQPCDRLLSAQAPASAPTPQGAARTAATGSARPFGEALGAMYADKHGMAGDLSPGSATSGHGRRRTASVDLDLARGHRAGDRDRPRASRHPLRDLLRRVRQQGGQEGQPRPRRWATGRTIESEDHHAMPRRSRPRSAPIPSEISSRAALSLWLNSPTTPNAPDLDGSRSGAMQSPRVEVADIFSPPHLSRRRR